MIIFQDSRVIEVIVNGRPLAESLGAMSSYYDVLQPPCFISPISSEKYFVIILKKEKESG